MIAAPGSGHGKTTITCAVLAALTSLGKDVIAFKCGPDYVDPMFHTKAAGVESRNLDVFLMGEDGVRYAAARHSANRDAAVLEGVMGLYDGLGSGAYSSSNHISLLTNTPVILVCDPKGAALSVCAAIKGFLGFDKNNIRGIILNNVSGAMFKYYKDMIEARLDIGVIGYMPNIPEARVESRHLGLITPDEIAGIRDKIRLLGEYALRHIDFDALLRISETAEPFDAPEPAGLSGALPSAAPHDTPPPAAPPDLPALVAPVCSPPAAPHDTPPSAAPVGAPKIYVARDEAFCFRYEDNLDLLRAMGAEIRFFSPVHDGECPDDADGLILLGGYPELHGEALANNINMARGIKSSIGAGVPVYAEGGGFMYLLESLTDFHGNTYNMTGVLPGNARMTQKLQHFGYYEITAQRDNMLCRAGDRINAHFFHRSACGDEGDCFMAVKQNGASFPCIFARDNVFAGYQHLHFWSNPSFARNFIEACKIRR